MAWCSPGLLPTRLGVFGCLALLGLLASCSGPRTPATSAPSAAARAAPSATSTPSPAPLALAVVQVVEAALPPPPPTPDTVAARRETPTPAATPEAGWKYVTIVLAVENRSDTARLVGIAGADPATTNLAGATLNAGDGKRYKPLISQSSFGQRTATGRSLISYPVLLRLPPHFRAVAESFGTQSVQAPPRTSLTFRLPATLTDYGTLSVPPLASLGPKSGDDDVSSRLRPLIGALAPADVAAAVAAQTPPAAFPVAAAATGLQSIGGQVSSSSSRLSVTLSGVDVSNPADFQARNRGWKQISLALRYHNDDPQQPRAVNVAAWLFGGDGVVYTGDVPAIGDFGRALTVPEPAALLDWDGRPSGADPIPPGQTQDGRRAIFLVPREMSSGVLVLDGDVEAQYAIPEIATPDAP